MLGNLYTVTNSINEKKYVGKTYSTLKERWADHVQKSKHRRNKFGKAIDDLGHSNFQIHLIGQFEEGELEHQEQLLISKLDTYRSGYNSTLGGDGFRTLTLTDMEVINSYTSTGSLRKTALELGTTAPTISKILKAANFEQTFNRSKMIKINELNKEFNSVVECAKYLISLGVSSAQPKSVSDNISKCLSGKKSSFLKYTYSYSL